MIALQSEQELARLDRGRSEGTSQQAELGRRVAGFVERDRRHIPAIGDFVWERGWAEPLPHDFPAKYMQTIDRAWHEEQIAAQQGAAAEQRADQEYARLVRVDEMAARVEKAKIVADPREALRVAREATAGACLALGQALKAWQAASAVIASEAHRKAAIEAERERQLAEVDREVMAAKLVLSRLQ